MENWRDLCGTPSNHVCVFQGCDFKVRVNSPSQSEQKPETKTFYWEGDCIAFKKTDSHIGNA